LVSQPWGRVSRLKARSVAEANKPFSWLVVNLIHRDCLRRACCSREVFGEPEQERGFTTKACK
jgi:hypothetical protein